MSFAQVQLLGNVGRDPEMNYTPDGTAVTKFSVAVSKKVKGEDVTVWYNCSAWRGLAEMINTHLRKGQMVFVQGELSVRSYVDRNGNNGVSLDVLVDKFQFAGGKKGDTPASGDVPSELGELEDHPF